MTTEAEQLLLAALGREDSKAQALVRAIIATRDDNLRGVIRQVLGEHSRALAFEAAIEQADDGQVPAGGLRAALGREDEAVRRLERALDVVLPAAPPQPILDEAGFAILDEEGRPILAEPRGGWATP